MKKLLLITLLFLTFKNLQAQQKAYHCFQVGVLSTASHVWRPATQYSSTVKEAGFMGGFLYGKDFGNRFSWEIGFKMTLLSLSTDNKVTPYGWDRYRYGTRSIPVCIRYRLPLVKEKLFFVPEFALAYTHTSLFRERYATEMTVFDIKTESYMYKLGGIHKLTYEAGAALETRWSKYALSLSCRYANTYNHKPTMMMQLLYSRDGVQLAEVFTKHGLEAVIFSLSLRKYLKQQNK